MPSAPNTWQVLKAIQTIVQTEVLVGGISPFSTFNMADQTKYGATNAIYIGVPKDWTTLYPKQCHIIPPTTEQVLRRAFGGKVWDWNSYYIRFLMRRTTDWYQTEQDILAARDALYPVIARHAELPNAPTVQAALIENAGSIGAYHHDEMIGIEWDCWGFIWKIKQQWYVPGGIVQ